MLSIARRDGVIRCHLLRVLSRKLCGKQHSNVWCCECMPCRWPKTPFIVRRWHSSACYFLGWREPKKLCGVSCVQTAYHQFHVGHISIASMAFKLCQLPFIMGEIHLLNQASICHRMAMAGDDLWTEQQCRVPFLSDVWLGGSICSGSEFAIENSFTLTFHRVNVTQLPKWRFPS